MFIILSGLVKTVNHFLPLGLSAGWIRVRVVHQIPEQIMIRIRFTLLLRQLFRPPALNSDSSNGSRFFLYSCNFQMCHHYHSSYPAAARRWRALQKFPPRAPNFARFHDKWALSLYLYSKQRQRQPADILMPGKGKWDND